MPADVTVEKHTLGAVFCDSQALGQVVERLTESDFWLERHAVLFAALRDAAAAGKSLDWVGFESLLTASGRLVAAGGGEYLREISSEVVTAANVEEHIRILRGLGTRRRLIHTLSEHLQEVRDQSKPLQEVLEAAEAAVLAVGDTAKEGPDLKSMARVIRDAAKNWQDRVEGKPGGVMSGIPALDDILMGFKPGKLYILAARPGLGKSMLALQIASQCGRQVAHYSLEMEADEQVERMVSHHSDLNSESLQSGAVIRAQARALKEATDKMQALPIWWCDQSPLTPMTILSQCRRLKKRKGDLGLIIVDYLQLIDGIGKFERRDLEVGFISKFLKSIAMKLQVPVIAIASLSRKNEERTDKRPINSDLRESGSIESDADGILFLYRESDYNKQAAKDFPNTTEIIVSKHRGGRKGRGILEFDGAHSKFYTTHPEDAKKYAAFVGGKHDSAQTNPRHPVKVSGKDAQSSDF